MSNLNPSVTQNTDAIKNYAGSYSKDLIGNQLLQALEIIGQVKVIYNLKAPLNLTKLMVNGGIRPLDTAVNKADKPGRIWSKRTITPKVGMKIFEVVPEELRDTWMSEMLDPNAKDVPFAQWVWDQEFAKLADEINETLFNAVDRSDADDFDAAVVYQVGDYFTYGELRHIYQVVTVTVAGQTPESTPAKFTKVTAASICDGPGTLIKKAKLLPVNQGGLAASNIIATNIPDASNAVAEFTKVYEGAPEAMQKKKNGKMYCSRKLRQAYKKNYDTLYGTGVGIKDDTINATKVFLRGTDVEIIECNWMFGSNMIIYTLADNFLMGTNLLSDITGFSKMVDTLHGFSTICKWIMCFQFADMDVLFVNDKA
jgi:hypothetical protein